MNPVVLMFSCLGITLICVALLWLVSLPLKNTSIIDIFWGPGFSIVGIAAYMLAADATDRGLILAVLVVLWGIRLGGFLALRNIGHGEDKRYQAMRAEINARGGNWPLRSLFTVFVLQGVILWIVSWPVQLGQFGTTPLGGFAAAGVGLWLVGFLFEAVGDWQLYRFKSEPANQGKVMDQGLWRYTRHPNYFGNACIWWGIWLVAAPVIPLWVIVCPAFMTILLLKVSGVALLEKDLSKRKPGYREYIEKTSSFVPWPPKK